MQIEIPFFYRSIVDVLNGPKEVPRVVFDTTVIDIADATGHEAPIALTFEDSRFGWARRHFRTHDGEFYGGYMTVGGRQSTRRVSAMKPMSCGSSPPRDLTGFLTIAGGYPFKEEWPYGRETMEKWWRADLYDYPDGVLSPLYVVKHHDDARDKRLDDIARAAKGLLVVDGMLHFRTAEPTLLVTEGCLSVITDFGLPRAGASYFAATLSTTGRLQMSMLELDRAASLAYGADAVEQSPKVREIQVHVPEAFTFDSVTFQAMMVATDMLFVMSESLGDLSASDATSWAAMRDAVNAIEDGIGDTAELVELVHRLTPTALAIAPRLARPLEDLGYVALADQRGFGGNVSATAHPSVGL